MKEFITGWVSQVLEDIESNGEGVLAVEIQTMDPTHIEKVDPSYNCRILRVRDLIHTPGGAE